MVVMKTNDNGIYVAMSLVSYLIISNMASLNFGPGNVNGRRGAEKRFALFDFSRRKKSKPAGNAHRYEESGAMAQRVEG